MIYIPIWIDYLLHVEQVLLLLLIQKIVLNVTRFFECTKMVSYLSLQLTIAQFRLKTLQIKCFFLYSNPFEVVTQEGICRKFDIVMKSFTST